MKKIAMLISVMSFALFGMTAYCDTAECKKECPKAAAQCPKAQCPKDAAKCPKADCAAKKAECAKKAAQCPKADCSK